jgi:hypothetical protein
MPSLYGATAVVHLELRQQQCKKNRTTRPRSPGTNEMTPEALTVAQRNDPQIEVALCKCVHFGPHPSRFAPSCEVAVQTLEP